MIPISTTLIRVLRAGADSGADTRDPWEAEQPNSGDDAIASGVRAVISSPSGRERNIGGTAQAVEFAMSCDPVDLQHTDTIVDERTGGRYQVVWVTQRVGFGMDHTRAGLKQVEGFA